MNGSSRAFHRWLCGQMQAQVAEHHGHEAEEGPRPPAADHAADEADGGQAEDEDVDPGRVREQHLPVRVRQAVRGVADRTPLVGHVGHVGAAEQERQRPEGGQQAGHRRHRQHVAGALAVRPEHEHSTVATDGEDADDQVAEHGQREEDRGEGAALAGAHAPGEHAEVQHRHAQGEAEGELARHRRRHVAAVDRERPVEEEERPPRSRTAAGSGTAGRPACRTPSSTPAGRPGPSALTILRATP